MVKGSQNFIIVLYYSFVVYFTAGSSRDGEPSMPEALLDNKHEMDDWRHVDTVSYFI